MLKKLVFNVVIVGVFLGIGLWAGPMVRAGYDRLFPERGFERGDYTAVYRQAGKPVVMFSTSRCPFCQRTRELFQREKVAYHEYKIDESVDAKRLFKQLDGTNVPLLFIGDRRIVGFREDVIRESLVSTR